MDHIEIEVLISNLEGEKVIKTRALVDTGATFTVISESITKELNLKLTGEKIGVSIAKRYDELVLTHVLIEINNKRRILPILISKHMDRILLGVIVLKAMQLRVNPITERLEEFTALLY